MTDELDRMMAVMMGCDGEFAKALAGWHPSTDISQAFQCLDEWCRLTKGSYQLTRLKGLNPDEPYRILLETWDGQSYGSGYWSTEQEAICRALADAVGGMS